MILKVSYIRSLLTNKELREKVGIALSIQEKTVYINAQHNKTNGPLTKIQALSAISDYFDTPVTNLTFDKANV